MGFTIVHGSPQSIWVPCGLTDASAYDIFYHGQIVRSGNDGVQPLSQADGAADTNQRMPALAGTGASCGTNMPFGVIVGDNLKTPTFSTALNAQSITAATPVGKGNETHVGVEGVWAKGDLMSMVKVALISPETVLRGPLYEDSVGTAPTVDTLSGTPTTIAATASATAEAGLIHMSTVYFRTGAMQGAYRVTEDTSTTAIAWRLPVGTAPASGDTIVRVNLRPVGTSKCNFGAEATFIDTGATLTTNYFLIDVIRLDLSTAGSEYCEFRFNPVHFLAYQEGAT